MVAFYKVMHRQHSVVLRLYLFNSGSHCMATRLIVYLHSINVSKERHSETVMRDTLEHFLWCIEAVLSHLWVLGLDTFSPLRIRTSSSLTRLVLTALKTEHTPPPYVCLYTHGVRWGCCSRTTKCCWFGDLSTARLMRVPTMSWAVNKPWIGFNWLCVVSVLWICVIVFHSLTLSSKHCTLLDSEIITDTLIRLVLYSELFGDYSREADNDAYLAADQFARDLFVWRKPVPKFRHSSVSIYRLPVHNTVQF